MTFGLKAAGWADELTRVHARLLAALETISVAQLGGGGGTLASLGGEAEAVLVAFCARLKLRRPASPGSLRAIASGMWLTRWPSSVPPRSGSPRR